MPHKNRGLAIMRRAKPSIPRGSLIRLADSLLITHLDYCSSLLHNFYGNQFESLLKLQKQCARTIFSVGRRTHCKQIFIELGWLLIHQRIEYNPSIMMFKQALKTYLFISCYCSILQSGSIFFGSLFFYQNTECLLKRSLA